MGDLEGLLVGDGALESHNFVAKGRINATRGIDNIGKPGALIACVVDYVGEFLVGIFQNHYLSSYAQYYFLFLCGLRVEKNLHTHSTIAYSYVIWG